MQQHQTGKKRLHSTRTGITSIAQVAYFSRSILPRVTAARPNIDGKYGWEFSFKHCMLRMNRLLYCATSLRGHGREDAGSRGLENTISVGPQLCFTTPDTVLFSGEIDYWRFSWWRRFVRSCLPSPSCILVT